MSMPVPRSLKSASGAQANRASHRHDDVGAFVEQGLAQAATVISALEVAGEQAGLRWPDPNPAPRPPCRAPRCSFCTPMAEAVHEDGHGRDLDAAVGADLAGLGHRQPPGSQPGRLAWSICVAAAAHVRDDRVVGRSQRWRTATSGLASAAALVASPSRKPTVTMRSQPSCDEGVDVLLVVGLLLRFQVLALDAAPAPGIFDALPGGGIEGLVIDTASVSHLAGLEASSGRRSWPGAVAELAGR